jgi:hypothetical protein
MKLKTVAAVIGAFVLATSAQAQNLIAGWDFTGENTLATSTADAFSPDFDSSNLLTRGPGAPASAGANSFRTTGFQNNGISTANTDYFQFTLSPTAGNTLSLSSIIVRTNGTASYAASPGVMHQFAYSLDGTNFTLIGAPVTVVGVGNQSVFDLSGVAALQGVTADTTVTLRYYASGQTTTGGWGFFSNAPGDAGLAVYGSGVTPVMIPEPGTYMLLGIGALLCVQRFRRARK